MLAAEIFFGRMGSHGVSGFRGVAGRGKRPWQSWILLATHLAGAFRFLMPTGEGGSEGARGRRVTASDRMELLCPGGHLWPLADCRHGLRLSALAGGVHGRGNSGFGGCQAGRTAPPCWLRSVARDEVFAVEADKLRRDRHAWVREAAFPDVADRFAGGSRLGNGEACLIH